MTTTRGGLVPSPFFEVSADWLPTAKQLQEAGLPGGPLDAVRLDFVRITPAGKWHQMLPGTPSAGCARVRRAAADGRALTRRQVALTAGLGLCQACAAQVRLRGRAGTYLDLTRHIITARAWTQALEQAAPDADWPAFLRWTARTPFTDEHVLTLLDALGGDPKWQPAGQAATTAWQQLWDRAGTAHARARQAAGPPGLRDCAAAARALVTIQEDTALENELIAAIAAPPGWRDAPGPAPGWGTASRAWAQAICLDGDPAAARTALAAAVEHLYGTARARDVALLPLTPACPGEEFCSPAAWADAEYQALRQTVARRWCQRLEAALDQVQAEAADVTGQWQLLLIAGWPPAAVRDRDLAYLASYPELARIPQPPTPGHDPESPSRAIVVLHVPGFAAKHAAAHLSPNLTATAGPVVPAGSAPNPDQVSALVRYAAAICTARSLAWARPER